MFSGAKRVGWLLNDVDVYYYCLVLRLILDEAATSGTAMMVWRRRENDALHSLAIGLYLHLPRVTFGSNEFSFRGEVTQMG